MSHDLVQMAYCSSSVGEGCHSRVGATRNSKADFKAPPPILLVDSQLLFLNRH